MPNKILPALIPKTWGDLVSFATLMSEGVVGIQIDITDGAYVPNVSWPYTAGGEESFRALLSGLQHLPHAETLQYQFDLMVEKEASAVLDFVRIGASSIVLHEIESVVATLVEIQPTRTAERPILLGIALPFDVTPAQFEPYKSLVDFVQIMGIREVGFQGQAFEPTTAHTVAALRAAYPELSIQVDGGVGHEQLHTLTEAGATTLVIGSAILAASDPMRALHDLQQELVRINE